MKKAERALEADFEKNTIVRFFYEVLSQFLRKRRHLAR